MPDNFISLGQNLVSFLILKKIQIIPKNSIHEIFLKLKFFGNGLGEVDQHRACRDKLRSSNTKVIFVDEKFLFKIKRKYDDWKKPLEIIFVTQINAM